MFCIIYVVIFMDFVCDYYMYAFIVIFSLCCVIEEHKSFVKFIFLIVVSTRICV
jgi:hypothetical protein